MSHVHINDIMEAANESRHDSDQQDQYNPWYPNQELDYPYEEDPEDYSQLGAFDPSDEHGHCERCGGPCYQDHGGW